MTKTVTETPAGQPTKVKTVAYKYGFIFEKIDALPEQLKEFATPEGRIVAKIGAFQFQYHYKDHLGNVRMTFAGEEPLLGTLRLTAEVDSLEKEKGDFANIESVRTTENAENSEYSVRVSAYSPAITSKVLRVEKGGSLSLRAAAKYEENKSILLKNNKLNKIKDTDLLPLVAVSPVNFGNSETKSYAIGVNLLGILPVAKKIVNVIKSPIITPKKLQNAVIEISFYKDSLLSEQIFSKQIAVSENAAYDWEILKDSLIFEESGFVRVSLRNSNTLPVLFDNLELRTYGTQKARIIQENHYEPFGMTLQGLDYVAEDTRKNSYLFNGKELQEELGLQLYDYHARQVDPQTGRMNSVDPLADKMRRYSPYVYCFDNPMRFIDPDGMQGTPVQQPLPKLNTDDFNKQQRADMVKNWKTIEPIIAKEHWEGRHGYGRIDGENCNHAARDQMEKDPNAQSKVSSATDSYKIYNEKWAETDTKASQALWKGATDYMTEQLEQKKPVMVGITYYDGFDENEDKTTDHWVVVVGQGKDENGVYFHYYDNNDSNPDKGTNGRLYLQADNSYRAYSDPNKSQDITPAIEVSWGSAVTLTTVRRNQSK